MTKEEKERRVWRISCRNGCFEPYEIHQDGLTGEERQARRIALRYRLCKTCRQRVQVSEAPFHGS